MSVGGVQILTRNVVDGNNTIVFADDELDNLYKQYGSSNNVTATFILTTASSYTDTRNCSIIMTGNQKIIRTNFNGVKRGKLFIKYQGEIKRAIIWIGNVDKIPRRCM